MKVYDLILLLSEYPMDADVTAYDQDSQCMVTVSGAVCDPRDNIIELYTDEGKPKRILNAPYRCVECEHDFPNYASYHDHLKLSSKHKEKK